MPCKGGVCAVTGSKELGNVPIPLPRVWPLAHAMWADLHAITHHNSVFTLWKVVAARSSPIHRFTASGSAPKAARAQGSCCSTSRSSMGSSTVRLLWFVGEAGGVLLAISQQLRD